MSKSRIKPGIVIILSLLLSGSIIYGASRIDPAGWRQGQKAFSGGPASDQAYNTGSPDDREFYENAFKFAKRTFDPGAQRIIGGIIPHHLLAADMIAEFFHNLRDQEYDSIILIGPDHFSAGASKIITSRADWRTPYGILEHDGELAAMIASLDNAGVDDKLAEREHAISGETAFIKRTFPKAKLLPLILNPGLKEEEAGRLGEIIYGAAESKSILVLASVDFSHGRDNETAQANDRTSIGAISDYAFDKLYDLDVDSPPALAALLRYSRMNGAEFRLLNNSNSALLAGKPESENITSYVTGFFVK